MQKLDTKPLLYIKPALFREVVEKVGGPTCYSMIEGSVYSEIFLLFFISILTNSFEFRMLNRTSHFLKKVEETSQGNNPE
jgi:hypothetical protein